MHLPPDLDILGGRRCLAPGHSGKVRVFSWRLNLTVTAEKLNDPTVCERSWKQLRTAWECFMCVCCTWAAVLLSCEYSQQDNYQFTVCTVYVLVSNWLINLAEFSCSGSCLTTQQLQSCDMTADKVINYYLFTTNEWKEFKSLTRNLPLMFHNSFIFLLRWHHQDFLTYRLPPLHCSKTTNTAK